MNMDRFLANVPYARSMTNITTQVTETMYFNNSYNGALIMTLKTDNAAEAIPNPSQFESMSLVVPQKWNSDSVMVPQIYNRIEALQDVTFEEIVDTTYDETGDDAGMSVLEKNEVDIDYLSETKEFEYTHIALRNYAFPGFYDSLFGAPHQTWRDDYRLMCYRYQFFLDDDDAYQGNEKDLAFLAAPSENDSVDLGLTKVILRDESQLLLKGLYAFYSEIYLEFKDNYVDYAKDNCSFNDFNLRFNNFFIESMVAEYGADRNTPWFKMAAAYEMYQNIFTDVFGGDTIKMMEMANNILEQIRPETGTLYRLLEFSDRCAEDYETLKRLKKEAETFREEEHG